MRLGPPPGLERSGPVFRRARRLAAALFGVDESYAEIVLLSDGRVWRSAHADNPAPPDSPLTRRALETAAPVWVEDLRQVDELRQLADHGGARHLRFVVSAPIRLEDGAMPGAIAVLGREPRPYDAKLAAALQDLADMVGEEWGRIRAAQDQELSRRERDAAHGTLSSIMESTPTPVVVTDRALRVIYASPSWVEARGLSSAQVVGRSYYDLVPEIPPEWRNAFERSLAGEIIVIDEVVSPHAGAKVQGRIGPWRRPNGEIGGLIMMSHDVTAIVDALDSTARSEERLKLAVDLAKVVVWDYDFERSKAQPRNQWTVYKPFSDGVWGEVDPRDRPTVQAAWRRFIAGEAPFEPEYRVRRETGEEVWVAGAARLIRDADGHPLRVVGAVQDITAHKAQEAALTRARDEAQEANRAKSSFLATISHEIRTPLNGLMGMVEAMSRGELDPEQRERLEVVRTSSDGLLTILNDLLDLSKIEAGKLTLEEVEFDIMELAGGARSTFQAIAENKGVTLDLSVSRAARGAYRGDVTRLRQVLHNLLSNALKFTERGSVAIAVRRRAGELRLTVRDTGIGMNAEQQRGLFRAFQQADASTARRFGGTGLGLAICRDLVQLMGGTISVASAEGRGTSFTVGVPLEKVEARDVGASQAARRVAPTVQAAPRPIKVLAAEDNSVNQLVLRTLLNQVGVEPTMVDDGSAAVEAWSRETWDLILMDVQMPRLDGPSATREIRAREARDGRGRTPIVALTANAMEDQVAEYLEAGMDGFVAKPIAASRLFAAIEAALALAEGAPTEAAA